MPLLQFDVRTSREMAPNRGHRLRQAEGALIAATIVIACVLAYITDRAPISLLASSLVREIGAYGLWAAVATYLLLNRPAAALRAALLVWLTFGIALTVVSLIVKPGLSAADRMRPVEASPVLYSGVLMLLPVVTLGWIWRSAPVAVQQAVLPEHERRRQLVYGMLAGTLMAAHVLFTASFAGISLRVPPAPYLAWSLAFEIGIQSVAEELFFRAVLFRRLMRSYAIDPWLATLITLIANVGIYLVRIQWTSSPLLIGAAVFYTAVMATVSCVLYRRFNSILPGWIANVLFSMAVLFRA